MTDRNGDQVQMLILGKLSALLPGLRRLLRDPSAHRKEQAVRRRVEAELGEQPPVLVAIADGRLVLLKPVLPPAVLERMRELREARRPGSRDAVWWEREQPEVTDSGKLRRGGTSAGTDVMAGPIFEGALAALFLTMGHQVTVLPCNRGADLVLAEAGERTVVLAKCSVTPVPTSAVEEVVAAKVSCDCHHGMLVTTSCFTRRAKRLAASKGVLLWDRERLARVIIAEP